MVPIGCPETSVINYHYSPRNHPEGRSSHLLRGGNLKSRTDLFLFRDEGERVVCVCDIQSCLFNHCSGRASLSLSAQCCCYICYTVYCMSRRLLLTIFNSFRTQGTVQTIRAVPAQEVYGQSWRSKAQTFHIKQWTWLCKWMWNYWQVSRPRLIQNGNRQITDNIYS